MSQPVVAIVAGARFLCIMPEDTIAVSSRRGSHRLATIGYEPETVGPGSDWVGSALRSSSVSMV